MGKETDPANTRPAHSPHRPGRIAPLLAAASLALVLLCLALPAHPAPSTSERDSDATAENPSSLGLTPDETAYLERAGHITMCVDPMWPPFEYLDENHEHQGMAADYFRLFAERIGVPVDVVPTESWTQSTEYLKQGKCDVLSMLNQTPERSAFLDFTDPYLVSPSVVVAREDASYVNGLDALSGKTLAMVPGYRLDEAIRRDHPDIGLVPATSNEDALTLVSRGKAYATACTLVEAAYLIRTMGLGNLKVAGHTRYDDQFRVGVAKGKPELLGIMSKAVASLTPREKNMIADHWISVRYETGEYRLIWRILAFVGLGALLTAFWLVGIARNNKRLAALNAQLRNTKRELELKNSELEQISRTDRLTRLANRGRIDECLQQEVHRALRYGARFSLILADLDHFKAVNDTLGHHAGDEVLVQFSRILKHHTRLTDICGRWGGEEFLIICPGVDENGAAILANHIRELTERHDFGIERVVTSSFGVACFDPDEDFTDLLARTDRALYAAKDAGRNAVATASGGILPRVSSTPGSNRRGQNA